MYKVGIDVGSTYTKYCVIKDNEIVELNSNKTPVRQKAYFDNKILDIKERYPECSIVSCGYGKNNIAALKNVNELIALAKGVNFVSKESLIVLDIGGQDTKIIKQEDGALREFFVNDKCAAGSGMFLSNTCNLLGIDFTKIELIMPDEIKIDLSSVCVVFAQSEIVELISGNIDENTIISAVIKHIFQQSKKLLAKVNCDCILLSGGLTNIKNIDRFAEEILQKKCIIVDESHYLSAIGCALLA